MAASGGFGPIQLGRELGLSQWQVRDALRRGLIPDADLDGRWSGELVTRLHDDLARIREAVGDIAPAGSKRCAERLAELSGLEVRGSDVTELAEQGLIEEVDYYKDWPLYTADDVAGLAEQQRVALERVVEARQVWEEQSLSSYEVRDLLREQRGWTWKETETLLRERGLLARFGRVARSDVDALAGDEDLDEAVRAERLVGPERAAAHLEIRRTDFEHLRAAGCVTPARWTTAPIGRRNVDVPLFRTGDLEELRENPPTGVDWETVRGARPGERSPLLDTLRPRDGG